MEENKPELVSEYLALVRKAQERTPRVSRYTRSRKTFRNLPHGQIEVRLSGSGGEGVILAAIILAEAAGIIEGKTVVQTQSYGVEARGGASRAEVIISDGEIAFPEVETPDILLCMNQASLAKFKSTLRSGGILIYNSNTVEDATDLPSPAYAVPLSDLAQKAGGDIVANMVALGALVSLTKVTEEQSMRKAIMDRIPKGSEAMNNKAFDLGRDWAVELV